MDVGVLQGPGGKQPGLLGVPKDQAPIVVGSQDEGAGRVPQGMGQPGLARHVDAGASASGSAGWEHVLEELGGDVLFEGIDDGAGVVGDQELADVGGVQGHADEGDGPGGRIMLAPKVGQAEGVGNPFPVEVVGQDLAAGQAQEGPVEQRVGDEGDDAAGDDLAADALAGVEVPYGQVVLDI